MQILEKNFRKIWKLKSTSSAFFIFLMLQWQYMALISLFNKMSLKVCFFYVCGWTNTEVYL